MSGEPDVAPPLLRLREKENISHKVTEARSRDRKNIGVMLDAPTPALSIHTNTDRAP